MKGRRGTVKFLTNCCRGELVVLKTRVKFISSYNRELLWEPEVQLLPQNIKRTLQSFICGACATGKHPHTAWSSGALRSAPAPRKAALVVLRQITQMLEFGQFSFPPWPKIPYKNPHRTTYVYVRYWTGRKGVPNCKQNVCHLCWGCRGLSCHLKYNSHGT